ncbi:MULTISPECIES: hypothetical protein [Micromonospora]|uniref:hypothetical protein n=1 Tax=Micromonospora TaxID=1873 RepID=UPI0006AF4ED1|nr:hypothetical protein [Micromonospora sp. NRRL B-16802]KOX03164.1 hypothetical protein ADK66_28510 [Micromonospora sp. NRRL B-16802]
MTQTISHLDDLAEYPSDWKHQDKQIFPGENLAVPGGYLKWYDIRLADQEATPEVSDEARAFLRAEVEAGRLEFRKEIGFVMLHRDGAKYFMLVCVWRDKTEMWQGLYYKDQEGFLPYPPKPGFLRPTQEVVELDCTSHERRGWSRYLQSNRDAAAKQAYIDDACTGQLI